MASVAKREWAHKGEDKFAWVVRYKEGGKHRSRQFEKKKDADTFKRKVENELEGGTHIALDMAKTVKQVAELFLRHSEDRMKDGRIGRGRYVQINHMLDQSIVPLLGHKVFAELVPADVEKFYASMCRGVGSRRGIAPHTAMARITLLKMMVGFAVRRGYLKKDVVSEGAKDLRGIKKPTIKTFTSDEVKRLLDTIETRGRGCQDRPHLITKCAVHLAAFGGLRLGEILGLTVENLDLERGIIKVRHSLTIWDELKGPKTEAGVRDVPMPSHVRDMLREWVRLYYIPNDRGLVFRNATGTQIQHSVFNLSNWIGLLKRASLWTKGDVYHFHALRHFCASWMIENGLSLPDVASLLGHSKFDMTLQVYAHPVVGGHRRHEMIERMVGTMSEVRSLPAPVVQPKIIARGKEPFGFKFVNGEVVINREEQAALATMREMRAQGATLDAIGARFGKRASSVKRFLERPVDVYAV